MARAERSDKGTIRVTERDLLIFNWLADMKAVYETDLRILIGRMTDSMPGESAIRALVNRWHRSGLAKAQKIIANKPRIVMLLPNGAGLVSEPNYKETSIWTAYHQAEVSHVRLWLEGGGVPGMPKIVNWQSERAFRQAVWEQFKDGTRGVHVPDAVLTLASGAIAGLEVERTEKGSKRLKDIVERMTVKYDLTIYAAQSEALRRQVEAAYKQVKAEGKAIRTLEIRVWDYPSVLEV